MNILKELEVVNFDIFVDYCFAFQDESKDFMLHEFTKKGFSNAVSIEKYESMKSIFDNNKLDEALRLIISNSKNKDTIAKAWTLINFFNAIK